MRIRLKPLDRWIGGYGPENGNAVRTLSGRIVMLPSRRRRRRVLPVVVLIVLLAIGCSVSTPRSDTPRDEVPPAASDAASESDLQAKTPGGPAEFVDDPRLGQCFGSVENMEFVFEMTHARDYQQYFPNMLLAPELDIDETAFVVVYRKDWDEPPTTGFPVAGRDPTPQPGHRYVCMVLPGLGPVLYGDVDITGLTVAVIPKSPAPGEAAPVDEPDSSGPTPSPAPAWLAGAEAALACDGPPSAFGSSWTTDSLGTTERGSPEIALREFTDAITQFQLPFPTAGYREVGRTEDVVAFAYGRLGGARAVVRVKALDSGGRQVWFVDDVAGCDPSEFGPEANLPLRVGGWRDEQGRLVPTTEVGEIEDCYNGTKLTVAGRLYVWDPAMDPDDPTMNAYGPEQLDTTMTDTEPLPADAIDSGYRSDYRQLYLAADGAAAFIVTGDRVERWPHVMGDEYQRTDCN